MNSDLSIVGGTIVTPDYSFEGTILVRDGKIHSVSSSTTPQHDTEVINAGGLHVLPGIIDTHVHFREPGLTHKEDFTSGSTAAVMGGVTTVADMPNTIPPTSTVEAYWEKRAIGEEKSYVDFSIIAVILQDSIGEVLGLAEAGIGGYKIFMGPTVGGLLPPDDGAMLEALELVATTGKRCAFHAESHEIIHHLQERLQREGRKDPLAHVDARPVVSSLEAVGRAGLFAKHTGAKIHIMHQSSNAVCDLVRQLRAEGVDVTVETAPHYLLFCAEDMERLGVVLKINDPIRYRRDSDRLWDELKSGTINMIATDHSPHLPEEKFKDDIWEAIPGFPGVETSVRLMLTEVNKGRMTINEYVRFASENPARVWGLYANKGSLLPGTDADFTIVDMKRKGTIRAEDLHSKGKYTPYEGMKTAGLPVCTIVRGNVQMQDGDLVGKPIGQYVSSGSTG
ncbi:MAG: allantoinase AllB [Actinomycetota bacterium]